MEATFRQTYGPWAVVTGAAQGVGLAYVEALLDRGVGVVLVDRDPEVVEVAARLGTRCRAVVADLLDADWLSAIDEACVDLDIGLAIANAGVSPIGHLVETDRLALRSAIDLNCGAVVDLASWAMPRLIERGRGGFVVMSSGSALAGTAGLAVYSATKAFGLNLAEALAVEAGPHGVDVQAVVGPSMDTPAFRASDARIESMPVAPVDPSSVVEGALDALGHRGGPAVWLPDEGLAFLAELPRAQRVEIMAEATAAMYPRLGGPS